MNEFNLLIADAKSRFGEIHRADIEDDVFLFRLLTRKEYKDILLISQDQEMTEELVCEVAVIYPEGVDFSNTTAGTPTMLAEFIVNESGFNGTDKSHFFFEKFRFMMNGFEAQGEAAIQAAFPHITDEMMEEWTVEKFFKTLAKAEWLLQNVHGYPISFTSVKPEEPEDGEEVEEEEPPTFKELGDAARKEGIDPMLHYAPHIVKPRGYAEFPFIAGTEYWKKVF